MNTQMLIRALIAVGLAFSVASCGGDKAAGGDRLPVTGAEAAKVKATANTVITDPSKSCALLTPKALAVYTEGVGGVDGIKQCQEQIEAGELPARATIVVLEVKGDNASVGYTTDLVTGAMQLVKVRGDWLMNRITTLSAP